MGDTAEFGYCGYGGAGAGFCGGDIELYDIVAIHGAKEKKRACPKEGRVGGGATEALHVHLLTQREMQAQSLHAGRGCALR